MILGILSAVLPVLKPILERVIPDPEARAQAEAQIQQAMLANEAAITQAAASVVRTEVQGASWLQRNWRPMLMVLFGIIIANNYVLAPYVRAFGFEVPTLEIPNGMWALLNVGVGGYVVGRSAEKIYDRIRDDAS